MEPLAVRAEISQPGAGAPSWSGRAAVPLTRLPGRLRKAGRDGSPDLIWSRSRARQVCAGSRSTGHPESGVSATEESYRGVRPELVAIEPTAAPTMYEISVNDVDAAVRNEYDRV
jgi:hypothetical protein